MCLFSMAENIITFMPVVIFIQPKVINGVKLWTNYVKSLHTGFSYDHRWKNVFKSL